MNRKLVFTALAASVLAIGNAGAVAVTTDSAAFNVTITIQNSCGITASDVGFGTFADASVAHNEGASGTISVTCTGKGPIAVTLDAGANVGTGYGDSQMVNGANFVGYALYNAANGTGLLGDGTGTTNYVFNGTSTGAQQDFTIHGYTNTTGGPVPDGVYADVVTATVNF